ncbi:CapA family protein [Fictibacillus sp. WQ 8-8]|uniref:CapA family protein n=1 Tax=Fictibacillus sp. WQ 8-8 TaxID=2938788 RepID=UPI00210DF51A|nr:CapA family protein [Fictibacillus sp. WQ 8-8]MCQ6268356.1 CapA family protein [Fictibacillus sp. WQ 8-8]
MTSSINIVAVGDITLSQKPGEELLRSSWDSAHVRIGNLEGPLVEIPGAPADKQFRLQQPIQAGEWLKELQPTLVSIANNHTMDWGPEALYQTIEELNRIGVKFSGAGRNIDEAIQPVYINVENHRIAFLSWASTLAPGFQALKNRPGIAGLRVKTSYEIDPSLDSEQPGTPPWIKTEPLEEDLVLLEKTIEKAYKEADFVILAIHWGVPPQWCVPYQGLIAEYQPIIAQRAAKAGADIIIGHHAHAPYGMESFSGKGERQVPVLYSLGNYISHYEYLKEGLDISSSTMPHFPPSLPENKQCSISEIELTPVDGRLKVERLKIQPAVLSQIGETIETSKDETLLIANRLNDFSNQRGTQTFVEDHYVVWENNQNQISNSTALSSEKVNL